MTVSFSKGFFYEPPGLRRLLLSPSQKPSSSAAPGQLWPEAVPEPLRWPVHKGISPSTFLPGISAATSLTAVSGLWLNYHNLSLRHLRELGQPSILQVTGFDAVPISSVVLPRQPLDSIGPLRCLTSCRFQVTDIAFGRRLSPYLIAEDTVKFTKGFQWNFTLNLTLLTRHQDRGLALS